MILSLELIKFQLTVDGQDPSIYHGIFTPSSFSDVLRLLLNVRHISQQEVEEKKSI
jgi:hypothetical protein